MRLSLSLITSIDVMWIVKKRPGVKPPRPDHHLYIVEESRPPVHWEPILNNSQSIGFQDLLGNNPITEPVD